MEALLICVCAAKTSGDLVPPFEVGENKKIGYWEVGGSAIAGDESIMLVPPIQFHKGYAWTNAEVPKSDWSIQLDMQIHEGTNGGGFGVWLIDKYGASGFLHGGPDKFSGLALLGTVKPFADMGLAICLNLLQSNGTQVFSPENLPKPDFVVEYVPTKHLILDLEFAHGTVHICAGTDDIDNLPRVISQPLSVSIADAYLGVTAQSESFTSRIDLFGLQFNIGESQNVGANRKASLGSQPPTGQYVNPKPSVFRNPALNITANLLGHSSSEANLSMLFDVIDELNVASFQVASFKELNEFVRTTVLPYSQKWHKRTLKIIEEVKNARNVIGSAWNYTHGILYDFNQTLIDEVFEANSEIMNLESLIVSSNADQLNALSKATKNSDGKWMIYAAVAEFVTILAAFAVMQIPSVKNRVIKMMD